MAISKVFSKLARAEPKLAAELEAFEEADGFVLAGDDLGLPDEADGHDAHGDGAKSEDKTHLRFGSGKTKEANQPSHGKGSPSTRRDLLRDPTRAERA